MRRAGKQRLLRFAHEAQGGETGGESPLFIEGNHLVMAVEFEVFDKQERGMRGDGVQQHSPETQIAMGARYDHVKDDGFVNEIRENARKSCETAGFGIAESEDQI